MIKIYTGEDLAKKTNIGLETCEWLVEALKFFNLVITDKKGVDMLHNMFERTDDDMK